MSASLPRVRPTEFGLVAAPLPALAIGVLVMSRAGVPPAMWAQNLVATVVGVLCVFVAQRGQAHAAAPRNAMATRWLIAVGMALLGGTLVQAGAEGVHRWLSLGPVRVHAGAVLLPAMLVLLGRLERAPSFLAALLTLSILALQPDVAQAAAFAAGWIVSAAMARGRMDMGPGALVMLLAAAAFLRPDALQPVLHVEGIVGVAAGQGRGWAAAGLAALALPPGVLLLARDRRSGTALAAYVGCTLLAAWLGDFPVPFLGYGVSPILGYYLAVALLGRPAGALLTHPAPSLRIGLVP